MPTEQPGDIHTFDTFIEGYSNKFAYRAAMAVAKDPGGVSSQTNYNPLFIYGPSGRARPTCLTPFGTKFKTIFRKSVFFM